MDHVKLELKGIRKSYLDGDEKRGILNDLSLSVDGGELVAIVGPSGSGKSTLLTIAGLMQSADSGEICINGVDYAGRKQKEWTGIRQKHIGFIFQNHQLLPFLRVRDQLEVFREKSSGVDPMGLLRELGIDHLSKKYPAHLSGGEKQRVAIARAFINDPDLILADEPTASLDFNRSKQIAEMLQREIKTKGKAGIMVTHDERILSYVDAVYDLKDGKLERRI